MWCAVIGIRRSAEGERSAGFARAHAHAAAQPFGLRPLGGRTITKAASLGRSSRFAVVLASLFQLMLRGSQHIFSRWGDSADVHRDTYRIFCVMASVLNPVFGLVYQITDPEAFDPLWARLVLSVAALLLLSLSYMVRWVEQNFIVLVRGYFYLLIVFIIAE